MQTSTQINTQTEDATFLLEETNVTEKVNIDYKNWRLSSSKDVLLWKLMELLRLDGNISLSKIFISGVVGGELSGWQ